MTHILEETGLTAVVCQNSKYLGVLLGKWVPELGEEVEL